MNDSSELIKKYPWLKVSEDETQHSWADLMPQGWRVAFGDFFFEDLDNALKTAYPDGIPKDFRIIDLKEKWGKLTVYLTNEPEVVSDVLWKYEYISSFVCIICGAPYPFAQMTYDGWVMPLCERCYVGKHGADFDEYHKAYLQTVLKDSLSVCEGPEDFITIICSGSNGESEKKIEIKETWKKIFEQYVQNVLV